MNTITHVLLLAMLASCSALNKIPDAKPGQQAAEDTASAATDTAIVPTQGANAANMHQLQHTPPPVTPSGF